MEHNNKQQIAQPFNREVMVQLESKYSNIVSFEGSFFDFKMYFGVKKDIANPNLDPTDFHTAIIMSPEHAKEMSRLLVNQIKEYEKNVGHINEVPNDGGK